MPSSSTIPVRLHPALLERLDLYAAQLGVSRNAAIKLCLANQFGLIASLQPGELLNLDGRSLRHRKKAGAGAGEDAGNEDESAGETPRDAQSHTGVSARLEAEIKQAKEAKRKASKKSHPTSQPWP